MESVDLGDRKNLIDLIYGPPKDGANSTVSTTNSTVTTVPVKENERNRRKEKSRVVCSVPTAVCLFILVALSIFLAAFASYWLTRMDYEKQIAHIQYNPPARRNNASRLFAEEEDIFEEDEPIPGKPTFEELRLPDSFVPVWYNISLKFYVPGYVDFPAEKKFTTDGHILMKLKAKENTDKIVLHAQQLAFPSDVAKFKVLAEKPPKMRVRRETATTASNGNETEAADETPLMDALTTTTEVASTTTTVPVVKQEEYVDMGIKVKSAVYNETVQKITFTLDKPVSSGQEIIFKLPFKGKIDSTLEGLFASRYRTSSGEVRTLAVTHLEPTYARKVFPCLDEPSLKAIWKFTVIHPNGTIARNNEPEIEEEPTDDPNWLQTSFEESQPRSSYLNCLTISDFESREATTKSGLKIRAFARPEAIEHTAIALRNAVAAFEYLQDYFGIELPSKKQDIFAVPDFEPGAMENPGLLMFREASVLYNEKDNAPNREVSVAQHLGHEITHQWFGNLVTLKGWDSLWLNEAFANYMEYEVLQKLMGEKRAKRDTNDRKKWLEYQMVSSIEQALDDDAKSTSHPLTMKIDTADDAYEIFDSITYEKGAAIVRMIKATIGEEAFRKGVQTYINKFKFGNANYTDLWAALNTQLPTNMRAWNGERFDVAEFANKWILQMGYPVLDVFRLDAQNIEISQRRFKQDHLTPERAKFRNALYWYKWDIPLFMEVNGVKQPMKWLHEAYRMPLNLTDRLIINGNGDGFYRVNYDDKMWMQFTEQLQKDHTKIDPTARGRLLSDAFALASANQLPYESALNLSSYLGKETDYVPLTIGLNQVLNVVAQLGDSEEGDKLHALVGDRLKPLFEKVDIADNTGSNDFFEATVKAESLAMKCTLDGESCKPYYKTQFADNLLNTCKDQNISSVCSQVPLRVRSEVYCNGVSRGDGEEFMKILGFAKNEVNAAERGRLISALACSREPRALRRLLDTVVERNNSWLKTQDLSVLVSSMNGAPVGSLLVQNYVIDNWKKLYQNMKDDRDILTILLNYGISPNNERELDEVGRFLYQHRGTTGGFGVFKKKMENARSHIRWLKIHKDELKDYVNGKMRTREEL